jgi:hypothetical protein
VRSSPVRPPPRPRLAPGQIIESINGQALKDIDPRIQLGQILEAAEAGDGILAFQVKDAPAAAARTVSVKIPVLGAYSKTWPLDCPKSEKIVRGFADYLKKPGSNKGFADIGMLFLLSTGDEADLPAVREWVHGLAGKNTSGYAWHIGYGGPALCEYYLRTGDPVALPVIQKWVAAAAKGEYLDGWAGRGGVTGLGYGNGHLNAGGTHVVTFLLLAKQCGAEVDDSLLHRTLVHFFRYAGRGLNPYGDDRPENSFVDNGKNGKLAFAMAAAAALTPDGENSIYAKARDHMAMTGFYTTTFMLHGHTGGGIGEIWRSAAMNLLADEKPLQYREFMDHRKWHYDLSRRFDGSFAILGGAGYDKEEWGAGYALTYTIPRKTLRLTGAPPSKFAKAFQLPANPWGAKADAAFVSLDPVPAIDGPAIDVAKESLASDSAKPLIIRLNARELEDDEIRRYLHHPDYLVRNMVSLNAAGLSCDYMFPKPGQRVRPQLLVEFASHPDPRVRNAGFRAAARAFDPAAAWSQELFALALAGLQDAGESWWVKDACLALVARGTPDMIVPHIDVLLPYLKHQEQWLQSGALAALMNVVTDERCFEKVLPPVGQLLQTTPRQSTTGGAIWALREKLPQAGERVRALALKVFGDAYANYSGGNRWPGGQDLAGHERETLERLAGTLASVPGGYDVLYQLAKQRRPQEPLPYSAIFLEADPADFGPALREAIKPIIRDELIYQFIGKNRRRILADLSSPGNRSASVTNSIDELVSLYQKIGVRDFDWQIFGPDLRTAEWQYHSFDPPEKQAYDKSPWRYRPVTLPQGMENWSAPGFDAARAGWRSGASPFAQYQGKLATNKGPSTRPDTIWPAAPRTLWEHEVLLVRGAFPFPAAKPAHLYRLRVDRGQGVGAGDGFKVFINGKALVEATEGLGRRAGLTLRGGWITPEFLPEFGANPVTLAAITFLRYGDRAIVQMPPVPQGIFSMWLEERKLPPLDDATFRKAAGFVPLLTSAWQAEQDPESSEAQGDDKLFRFDGRFVPDPRLTGTWTSVALVDEPAGFTPGDKPNPGRSPWRTLAFRDGGTTDSPARIWSGDTLIDLDRSEALKITPHSAGGADYLFIEAGGFGPKHPAGWKSQLVVLKRD